MSRSPLELSLENDGAQLVRGVLSADALQHLCAALPRSGAAGTRIFAEGASELLRRYAVPVLELAKELLGHDARPVRALLFNKTALTNWRIGWHQDRTIAVKKRVEATGFDVWSVKDGVHHVEPPFDIIASMLTIRVHLDATPMGNAPLLVAPGSHRLGIVKANEASDVAAKLGVFACTAEAGDAWVYATSILHMSERAFAPDERRVLHIDFANTALPAGLEWLGV